MKCALNDENCDGRVVYKTNFEDREGLADVIAPLCGKHALACEADDRVVLPLVRRMWEGGVFA